MLLLEDNLWFSPFNVIYHYTKLCENINSTEKKTKKFRKATEAYNVAIAVVGIMKQSKQEFWMQIVDDKESSPDIRTATLEPRTNRAPELLVQDVEVVEYGEYSTKDPIDEFILEKKLNKNYSKDTIIVCYVSIATVMPPIEVISATLSSSNAINPVYLLLKISANEPIYRFCQLHPKIGIVIDFNLNTELHNKKYIGVHKLEKGSNNNLVARYLPDEKHFPFEALGYVPSTFSTNSTKN